MGTDQASFAIAPSVLYREVDGQMVLLNLDTEQYYGLDRVGAHILQRITKEPFDRAFASLLADYEVDESVLQRDIDKLVNDLINIGVLRRTEAG